MTEIKARPTLYKGVQMRSRLEADYAATLDRQEYPWEYEPTCFAADGIQWLPDFSIAHHDTHTYIELKSAHLLEIQASETPVTDRIDALLTQMAITWQSEPEACVELVFWTYGAWEPIFTVIGYREHPWLTLSPALPLIPFLWPGMGQRTLLRDHRISRVETQ